MKRLIWFVLIFSLCTSHLDAQEETFPISVWFGINSFDEGVLGYTTHWNTQKSKSFQNLEDAGFNTVHAISSRFGVGNPIAEYDSVSTYAISQEILNLSATHGLDVQLQHYFNIEPASHFQRILIDPELELTISPGTLYEDINEFAFAVRNGENFTEGSIEGKRLRPGIHSSGVVLKDARPINKWLTYKYPKKLNVFPWANVVTHSTLFSSHYLVKCRLKIDPASHSPTEPVLTLHMKDIKNSGANVNESQQFLVQDFVSQDYVTIQFGADILQDNNYPLAPEPEKTPGDPRRYVYDVDIEVEWHGNVETWIDWVAIEDIPADQLFNGDFDGKIKNTAKTLNTHSALFNFYLIDEPWFKQLRTYAYIAELLEQAATENGIDVSTGKGLARSALQVDARGKQYYITNRLADPWKYYGGSDEYPLKNGFELQDHSNYTNELQTHIDNETIPRYTEGVETAELESKDIGFFTQIGSIGNTPTRIPYLAEAWLNVNLALALGAKEISYFLYPTSPPGSSNLSGLVYNRDYSGPDGDPFDPILENPYDQNPWQNIIEMNAYLQTIGPTLLKLDRLDTFTGNSIPTGNGVLQSINSAPFPEYIQIGQFEHQDTSEDYLFILNRMAREPTPADQTIANDIQTFTVELSSSSSRRLIEDIYASRTEGNSSAFYTLDASENTFQTTLGPGKAKLFRITDGLNGTLPTEEYYLSGEVYLNGDLLVADTEKLIVEPGTLIGTASTTSTTDYGNYTTIPEIVVEFDARLDIQSATIQRHNGATGLWGGILISSALGNPAAKPSGGPDTNIKIQQTVIEDAEIGVYISSSSVDEKKYDLSDNTIEDCEIGIKVLNLDENPVELDITDNTIKNCDIGIEMQGSEGSIVDNTIWGGDFGITCSISSSPRIKGNQVHTLTESGLYCVNNSSPLVHTNTASPSTAGGENSFYGCDRGVLAENNSFPYLGEVTFDNSNDGKNYIFNNVVDIDNDTGTFLYINAIYNYWSNVPSANVPPDSTRGLVSFTPWLSVPDPTTKSGKQNKYSTSDSLYLAALDEEHTGNFSIALAAYRSIVSIYPDSKTSQSAISGIVRALKAEDDADQIILELNAIITTHSGFQASDFARQQIIPVLTREGSFTEATTHVDDLLTNYSGTDFEPYVLFDQLFLAESQASAGQGKSELKEQFKRLEEKVAELDDSALKRYMNIKISAQKGTSIEERTPTSILLARNYPNPFNPETTIEYQLPKDGFVKIEIFNLLGQKVRTLLNTAQLAGINQVRWDSRNDNGVTVASGIYLYLVQAGSQVETGKMFLLK